jgi:nicotinamidase-related amidase
VTSLSDRPHNALLVVDMQNGVVAAAYRRSEVIANINVLVQCARAAGAFVVWVQDSGTNLPYGSADWQYVPELVRNADEPLVHKTHGDSFEETELEQLLAERAVGHLVVCGAQSEACIRLTLHGALSRGYDVTLAADAHTTEDLRPWDFPVSPEQSIAYTNAYWSWTQAPGRAGAVAKTEDITF